MCPRRIKGTDGSTVHANEERVMTECLVMCRDDAEERPGGLTSFIGHNGENIMVIMKS